MSIKNIKELQQQKGFTIVELLIVIVVIGILAAIVIVAFNGVQNQARSTQRKTDASSIIKLAEAYNADDATSGYPTTAAQVHGYTTVKLPTTVRLNGTALAAAPAANETATGPAEASGVKTYNWRACGASVGITVYYWDQSTSSQKTVSAGTGC